MRGSIVNHLAGRLQNAVHLSVLGLGRQVGLIGISNPALSLSKVAWCEETGKSMAEQTLLLLILIIIITY